MPRISEKLKLIKLWEQIACNDLLMLELFGKHDGNFLHLLFMKFIFNIVENQRKKEEEILDEITLAMVVVENSRYGALFVRHSVPKSQQFLMNVLPNLDENRFRQITRVNWTNFKLILELIKDDEVFHGPRSCLQFPVEMQLIIVLYRLGSSGEGASVAKIASLFGIGDGGTVQVITGFDIIVKIRLI